MTENRIENIARIASLDIEIVRDYVEYQDWDNMADHAEWLSTATDEDIASWIKSLVR